MIRTYLINKNELEKIDYSEEMLSADRREKIARLKRDESKMLSACAELLLIYALKQHFGSVSLPLNIEVDERSKLRIPDIPIYFNYSHANEYAVCSISDAPVGVDIEYFRVRELIHPDRILHPDEYSLLAFISNPNEKKKYFYGCWVAKESYLKNLGIGLIVRPGDFAVNEDHLKIKDEDVSQLKGHHSVKAAAAGAVKQGGDPSQAKGDDRQNAKADTSLNDNLSYLEKRYVHVLEPGEVRGTDWKFDAGYRIAVCSMEKDNDSIARLITAREINEINEIKKH